MSTYLSQPLNLCSLSSYGYTNVRIHLSMQMTWENVPTILKLYITIFISNKHVYDYFSNHLLALLN